MSKKTAKILNNLPKQYTDLIADLQAKNSELESKLKAVKDSLMSDDELYSMYPIGFDGWRKLEDVYKIEGSILQRERTKQAIDNV